MAWTSGRTSTPWDETTDPGTWQWIINADVSKKIKYAEKMFDDETFEDPLLDTLVLVISYPSTANSDGSVTEPVVGWEARESVIASNGAESVCFICECKS